jgi:hypothetical protein
VARDPGLDPFASRRSGPRLEARTFRCGQSFSSRARGVPKTWSGAEEREARGRAGPATPRVLAARLDLLPAERSSRGAATSWRGGAGSCRGCGSTRSIDSTPTRERLAGGPVPRSLAAARLPLHVRPRYAAGCPPARRSPTVQRFRVHLANHDVTLWAIPRAAREAAGVQAAHGLDLPWASSFDRTTSTRLHHVGPPSSNSEGGYRSTTTAPAPARRRRRGRPNLDEVTGPTRPRTRARPG